MPTPRKFSVFALAGLLALLVLSVATCRLDMLIKSGGQPVLSVAPMVVRDSARAGSTEVRPTHVAIKDGGGNGSFAWSASENYSWIRLSAPAGTAPDTLTIMLDPKDLTPGTYDGTVTVTSADAPDKPVGIGVTFMIQRPGLVVTPTAVDHGTTLNSGVTFTDNLSIVNTGTGTLTWTATKSKPWVTLGSSTGSAPAVVPVTINSAGLAAGTYRDQVVVTAPGATGSPVRVDVTLTIFAPGLAVTPALVRDSTIAGSIEPRTQTLHVSNSGNGAVTWTATKTAAWLTLSKNAGVAPDDVVLTLSAVGLLPGAYQDTIVFTSPEATNSPIRVPVEFAVQQPGLSVTPAAIADTAQPGETKKRTHVLTVSNAGGGTLVWTVAHDSDWIATSPAAGLAPGTITVTLDPRGLPTGDHTGNVVVTSPGAVGSPDTVPVTFTIRQPCTELSIVPDVVRPGTLDPADCEAPHRAGSLANLYGVTANAGDIFSIRLTASFNAYLILTDAAGAVLAENDECFPETGTACIMDFRVAATGHYLIEATSAGAGEMGTLTISVVRERPPATPQGIGQFHKNGATRITVGDTTTEDGVVFKGTISDPNVADAVRLEIELEPQGAPFTNAPTYQSPFVSAANGSVAVSVTTSPLTNNTSYRWQARACDRTGRCSPWIQFGGNPDDAADFIVSVVAPAPPGAPPQQGAKP